MSDHALFVMAPYLAAASFLAGTLGGLLNRSHDARLNAPAETRGRRGTRALTIGLVGTSIGHAVIVIWPGRLTTWSQPINRLLLVEAALFLFGVAVLAGLLMVTSRYVLRPSHERIGVIDVTFVAVFLVAIVSGLAIPVLYRWAVAWSAVTLAPYVRSVASLQPELRYLESMPYLVKLHMFSTSVVIALVPFTTPGRVCLAAANRMVDRALMPVKRALDRTWRQFQDRVVQVQERDYE